MGAMVEQAKESLTTEYPYTGVWKSLAPPE